MNEDKEIARLQAIIKSWETLATTLEARLDEALGALHDYGVTLEKSMIGKKWGTEVTAEDVRKTYINFPLIRVISPGIAVPDDYRDDRINVHLDTDGAITAMTCG